jgi:hypothetical protein
MDKETALLLGFLDGERQYVMGILEGSSEEQLRRPGTSTRPPSCWTAASGSCWARADPWSADDVPRGAGQAWRSRSLSSASMST